MPKNTKSKKERLQTARHVINDIRDKEGFKTTKKIRFGPRFFVAEGIKNKKRSIFKICLFTNSLDPETNGKFSREITFLKFIQNSNFSLIKKATPQLYAQGLRPRSWYIREFFTDKTQNIGGGNVRFKKSFFNKQNLNWIIKLFASLQSIKNEQLPTDLKRLLYPPNFNKHLWVFIKPHIYEIDQYMKWPGLSKLIIKKFKELTPIYNQAPRVLSHQEPYACHFLKKEGRLLLIDWESINWSNPEHDIVIIWMRAHNHPLWQKQLYQKFKRICPYNRNFDAIWTVEVFIQSFFNVISYQFYHSKKDLVGLAKFSEKKIKEVLEDKFKLYN